MAKQVPLGIRGHAEETVQHQHTLSHHKAELPPIYSTPNMIGLMEWAASNAMLPFLDEGEISVGTAIHVEHRAPSMIGMLVKADAELEQENGRFCLSRDRSQRLHGDRARYSDAGHFESGQGGGAPREAQRLTIMFTGHYSFSFGGKAAEKRIPLWLLFLAVQWIDVMWSVFVLLGIEKVRIVPGFTASNDLDLYYMPYTHSLLGVLCWSALGYVVCQLFAQLRGVRTGMIVAAAVFSHWILDLIVHRPDLTFYDSVGHMGFGLWNHRGAAFALEMAVLFGGAALLYRTAAHKARLAGFVIFLAAVQVVNTFFFPPPKSDQAMAISAFVLYVVLALMAWWVE